MKRGIKCRGAGLAPIQEVAGRNNHYRLYGQALHNKGFLSSSIVEVLF